MVPVIYICKWSRVNIVLVIAIKVVPMVRGGSKIKYSIDITIIGIGIY